MQKKSILSLLLFLVVHSSSCVEFFNDSKEKINRFFTEINLTPPTDIELQNIKGTLNSSDNTNFPAQVQVMITFGLSRNALSQPTIVLNQILALFDQFVKNASTESTEPTNEKSN